MSILSAVERARIEAAIKAAERQTSAEFLCVVARGADTYLTVPLLVAAAVALIAPLPLLAFDLGIAPLHAYEIQLALFILLGLALTRPAIAARLAPRAVRVRRAARLAAAEFVERGLTQVARRNGVLLFVPLAERHVEVIADRAIFAKVDPQRWAEVAQAFSAAARGKDLAAAFVAALERLGPIMGGAFPRTDDDVNEIPDRLVDLDEI